MVSGPTGNGRSLAIAADPVDGDVGWMDIGSRVNREVHARFWEGLGVRFPRATRHTRLLGTYGGRPPAVSWAQQNRPASASSQEKTMAGASAVRLGRSVASPVSRGRRARSAAALASALTQSPSFGSPGLCATFGLNLAQS